MLRPGGGAGSEATTSHGDAAMGTKPPASNASARENALFLLEATSADLGGDTFDQLIFLPFLPLVDGSLGRFLPAPIDDEDDMLPGSKGARAERAVFVCSAAERRLLAGEGRGGAGAGAGRRLLEDLEGLTPAVRRLLTDKRVHAKTNVTVMKPTDMAGLLDAVFPEAWKGLRQVAWAPGSRDVSICCARVFAFVLCVCVRLIWRHMHRRRRRRRILVPV